MIPAGYLLKCLLPCPEWLDAPGVVEPCNVAGCCDDDAINLYFEGVQNGFGLASAPDTLWRLIRERGCEISHLNLLYCEVYEHEMESEDWATGPLQWTPLSRLPSKDCVDEVEIPQDLTLLGYDVVVCDDYLEHSPLFCNSMAKTLPVNSYCLFPSLNVAKEAVESGAFEACEPGLYKIFSIYRVNQSPRDIISPGSIF